MTLVFAVVCSSLGTRGSEAALSNKLTGTTGSPEGAASAEDLQTLQSDDDGLENLDDHSGGENQGVSLFGMTRTQTKNFEKLHQKQICVSLKKLSWLFQILST